MEARNALSGKTPWYRAVVLVTLLTMLGCHWEAPGQPGQSAGGDRLQEARNAFFGLDLQAAREAFEDALEESSRPASQRAEAARRLANIAWRFDQNQVRANRFLKRAEELAPGEFETVFERVRLLAAGGELVKAARVAEKAALRASTREEKILCDATIAQLMLRRVRAEPEALKEGRTEIRAALDRLLPIVREDHGRLDAARTALRLALTLDDGPAALESWRAYYQVPPELARNPDKWGDSKLWAYPMMAPSHLVLVRILPGWKGPNASRQERVELVLALASSHFFTEAAQVAGDTRGPGEESIAEDPAVADILAYQQFLQDVARLTEELYRLRGLGETVTHELDDALQSAARTLWERLHFEGDPPDFGHDRFWQEISKRYGAQVYFRTDRGGHAVHLGHRVVEQRRPVQQYGRQTTIHFVVLDAMATNGYSSWFWDGEAATGGWVDKDGTVVQVRSSYAEGPLEAWSQLADPEARRELEKEIREKTARDEVIARNDPVAYLPGLALRLKHQAHERLLSDLRRRGLEGRELKAAFVSELGRLTQAASIFAHEGRHALERQNLPRNWFRSGEQKEFLAKLSEVAFAPDPRIALVGGILLPSIGDGSSHGQANQRIMRGLVDWMRDHAAEVPGLDQSRPLLPQLDLLSDEQLREAFRSQDPWAP